MPHWGFTDSIQQFTGVTVEHGAVGALLNAYAAVPSMHVCFALMIGLPMSRLVHHRLARVLWRIYPVFIAFVVVATGNHYFTDVVPRGAHSRTLSAARQAAAGPSPSRRLGVHRRTGRASTFVHVRSYGVPLHYALRAPDGRDTAQTAETRPRRRGGEGRNACTTQEIVQ